MSTPNQTLLWMLRELEKRLEAGTKTFAAWAFNPSRGPATPEIEAEGESALKLAHVRQMIDELEGATSLAPLESILESFGHWRQRNFGPIDPARLLLGVAEEFGELAKAHGDEARGGDVVDTMDAVGDTALYLQAYCRERGWSLRDCVWRSWHQVRDRDYVRYPRTGRADKEAKLG